MWTLKSISQFAAKVKSEAERNQSLSECFDEHKITSSPRNFSSFKQAPMLLWTMLKLSQAVWIWRFALRSEVGWCTLGLGCCSAGRKGLSRRISSAVNKPVINRWLKSVAWMLSINKFWRSAAIFSVRPKNLAMEERAT
ncbi:MAG: hypothetical protein N3B10_00920 [Armatimonadetes bacterium]|nr:hypothetical protein [Armatimonadota bacterium]MCX7967031.1 hypothetical protein [Armatimonadota bacterium]MDW8144360.1 hypothetical protein [Armatimonadota bacterium]